MKLSILVDFTCELGKTSKLAKVLKESGFTPRLLSHDVIRLRIDFFPDSQKVEGVLSSVSKLSALITSLKNSWKTICIETWAEEEGKKVESTLFKVDNICIYVRRGRKYRIIKKLAWTKECKWTSGGPIPESITRKCTEVSEDLNNTLIQVQQFLSTLIFAARSSQHPSIS